MQKNRFQLTRISAAHLLFLSHLVDLPQNSKLLRLDVGHRFGSTQFKPGDGSTAAFEEGKEEGIAFYEYQLDYSHSVEKLLITCLA